MFVINSDCDGTQYDVVGLAVCQPCEAVDHIILIVIRVCFYIIIGDGETSEKKSGLSTATIGIAVAIIAAIVVISIVIALGIFYLRKKKYTPE